MPSPIYDLEDRLIKFAGDTILFANNLPNDKAGSHLKGQIIRSSSSGALNYWRISRCRIKQRCYP